MRTLAFSVEDHDQLGRAIEGVDGVVHCPYCHGWEVRDRAIAVIATGHSRCTRRSCSASCRIG